MGLGFGVVWYTEFDVVDAVHVRRQSLNSIKQLAINIQIGTRKQPSQKFRGCSLGTSSTPETEDKQADWVGYKSCLFSGGHRCRLGVIDNEIERIPETENYKLSWTTDTRQNYTPATV